MGLFTSSSKRKLPWTNITSVEQLEEVLSSASKPLLLFKHSTRCSISSMALNNFENNWTVDSDTCDLYFIDLIQHRDVSNRIAEQLNVIHQSPQAVVVSAGEVIYHESHSGIDAEQIKKLL